MAKLVIEKTARVFGIFVSTDCTCTHLGSAVYFEYNAFENYMGQTKLARYSVSCNFQLFNMHETKVTVSSLRIFFQTGGYRPVTCNGFPQTLWRMYAILFQVNVLYSNWFDSKCSTLVYIFLYI